MSEVTLADLKGDMYELAISIGVEQTLELCSLFAGDNIYIPLSGKEINGDILELKEILGQELFESNADDFWRHTMTDFPTKSTVLRGYITKRIREEYDGTNRRRLMREYGLTKNSFYRIMERRKKRKRWPMSAS